MCLQQKGKNQENFNKKFCSLPHSNSFEMKPFFELISNSFAVLIFEILPNLEATGPHIW